MPIEKKSKISELRHFCPAFSNWEYWSIINFFRAGKINSEKHRPLRLFHQYSFVFCLFFKRARRKVDFANGRKKVDTMLYFTRQITANGINKVPITRYDKICKSDRRTDDDVSTVYRCKCIFDMSRFYTTQMVILFTITFILIMNNLISFLFTCLYLTRLSVPTSIWQIFQDNEYFWCF